ncbi:hypothetical protein [Quadrisphaera sp. INWT6]|uniref:hypothetical protein n=1 Tax=Quadrisphaera sp. INWT6 TaxID=2596917 RepID=UPI0018926AE1|nr:hypothetical protein [Quadrisphaera sp. INWT6]MBF5080557.1 hypothetical protein [Quadrisphaera sp. INWT6]
MSEHAHVTADQARTALAGADTARRGLAARGRWLAGYFGAFAVGSAVVVALIGLGGDAGTTLAMIGWVVLVSLGVAYASTRPVRLRREGRLHAAGWVSWGVVYGLVLLVGHPRHGAAAYWLPAALLSAVPLAATALLALRWSRR